MNSNILNITRWSPAVRRTVVNCCMDICWGASLNSQHPSSPILVCVSSAAGPFQTKKTEMDCSWGWKEYHNSWTICKWVSVPLAIDIWCLAGVKVKGKIFRLNIVHIEIYHFLCILCLQFLLLPRTWNRAF